MRFCNVWSVSMTAQLHTAQIGHNFCCGHLTRTKHSPPICAYLCTVQGARWIMLYCSHNLFILQTCLPYVCLISVTAFPWHILGHSIFWLMLSTHKSLICMSNRDETWKHNNRSWCVDRHWWFLWLVLHLPTVGGKWTSGQYFYKWTILMNWQVSTSGKYLLDRPVVGTCL